MRQFSVVIVVKNKEPGLLSIAENREKALVPLLNGAKIIDCYLSGVRAKEYGRVSVITEKDMTGVREHLVYHYNASNIRVIHEANALDSLFHAFRSWKRSSVLLLRADGLLLPLWDDFFRFLKNLPEENYALHTHEKKLFGFLIQDTTGLNYLKNERERYRQKGTSVDGMWELISDALQRKSKTVEYHTRYDTLDTVTDYYRLQFDLFHHFESLAAQREFPPSTGIDEKDSARITETGHVVDAYVSYSSTIEGFVKGSVIFPHVRVGKNARVINSVIMNHNHIGSGASVINTIICDNSELFSKVSPNVGEHASIGEVNSGGSNSTFSEYLHSGITLIGQNVEIPKEYKVSKNCYIASNIHRSLLKGQACVKAGETVLGARTNHQGRQ